MDKIELEEIIYKAIYYNDIPTLEKYIDIYGTNTIGYFLSEPGETPLFAAVRDEQPNAVDWLINAGADMYFKNPFQDNVLHLAARKGLLDIVEMLCEHNMLLDIIGQDGFTALNWAIHMRHDDVAICLINHGASLDIPDSEFSESPRDRIFNSKLINIISVINEKEL